MLFRRNLPRYCAAAAAPSPTAAPPVDQAAAKKPARVAKEMTPFRPMPIHEWQRRSVGTGKLPTAPLLFHGATLGPRPLIVLGGSSKTSDGAVKSATKFAPMLSQLQWSYGAIHISFDFDTQHPDALGEAADSIARVLDVLGVGWTHLVGHSVGALLAAKMAFAHPTRVGTIVSLDSPLVEAKWLENSRARDEIAKAQDDVNVPAAMLDFAVHTLGENMEPLMPLTDPADEAFYNDYLFSKKHLFGDANGVTRDDSRYLTIPQLQCVKHPLQFICPAQGAKLDVDTHKSFFGIRRLQPVKNATTHDGLFAETGGAAEEVSQMLEQWVNRFEPDVVYARRFEQAAKDMRARLDGASAGAAAAATDKPAQQFPAGKKKDQKKKK